MRQITHPVRVRKFEISTFYSRALGNLAFGSWACGGQACGTRLHT